MNDRGDGGELSCHIFVLGLASVLAIAAIAFLVYLGIPSEALQKGMVWLAVPWFGYWYMTCKKWHNTPIVFTDGDVQKTGRSVT